MTDSCPSCRAELPELARFCPGCGRPVAVAPAGERRVVTVVFADLAGFTTLAEGRDPEAVKELLDSCFGALVPVIEAHGGNVDKIIGDELMAVFGAPRAHEDDAERAVRAALALHDALEAVGGDLEMRVGINTGEVLAGPVGPGGAYTVTGDTVNTAHRLVGVAAPGEVLVGRRTRDATAEAIDYGPSERHHIRGKREPVVAHPARGARRDPGDRPFTVAHGPFVGRDRELGRVAAAVHDSVATSCPWLVTVTGEPGLGKSRLFEELAPALRRHGTPARILTARCAPYGASSPLAPLAAIARQALMVDPDAPRADQIGAIEREAAEVARWLSAEPGRLAARLTQLLGLDGPPDRRPAGAETPVRPRVIDELVSAARLAVLGAARHQPVVVVVDDAQWAAPVVLDFAERVHDWATDQPVTVAVVGREELLDGRAGLGSPRSTRHLVLALRPLEDGDARDLLRATLASLGPGGGILGGATEPLLLEAAGGNPLLLEQLVRYLVETGALVPVDEGWRTTRDLDEVGQPDDVRALLGARLDALPDDERAFLQAAAVVGRVVRRGAVAAVGGPDEPGVVDRLVQRGLLVAGPAGTGEAAFRHAAVREAAYASVPIGERATQHAVAARWLQERADPDDESVVAEIAHHFERAVTLSRELEHTDPGLAGAAASYLVRAARTAVRRDELREADRWFRRARDLGLADAEDALAVELEHVAVLVDLRRLADARETLLGVLGRARGEAPLETLPVRTADPRPRLVAEALSRLAVVERLLGDADGSAARFAEAGAAWRAVEDPAGEASTLRSHGWAELLAGRPRAALPKLLRTLELEDPDDPARGATLQGLGWCEYLVGDHAEARTHVWAAASLLGAAGDRSGIGWCLGILGFSLWSEGRVRQARTVAENLLATAAGRLDPWGEGMCLMLLALCQLEGGDPVTAGATADQSARAFAELADPWGLGSARLVQGMVARVLGDLPAAEATLRRGLDAARTVGAFGDEARLRAELAATLLDQGRPDAATDEARATLALVRSGSGDHDSEIRGLVVQAKVALATGDDDEARLLLGEATERGDRSIHTSVWRRATALLALVAAGRGDAREAETLAARAARGSWESARTWTIAQRGVAAAQAAAGNVAGAEATLEGVVGRFRDRPLAFLAPAAAELRQLRDGQGPG